MEVSYATMEAMGMLIQRLGQDARRLEKALAETMHTSAEWKRIADELKAERDAERKAHDEYKERNRELFHRNQRLTAELAVIKDERDALRAECDDLRRVFSMVHGSLGIRQGQHIGNAIDALKKERDELATRLRQSIARGDFAEMRAATLLAELAEQKPSFDPTVAKMESTAEASHITPEGKQTAEGAVMPKPGDVVRLVRVPTNDEYPHDSGRWEPNCGGIGDYMRVHYVGSNINGTRVVRGVFGLEWPLSCVEVGKGVDK